MQLPNVGKPGNILSILIPGTFLLFNIIVGLYLFLEIDLNILKNLEGSLSIIVFLLLVCFGYLLGAILRLLKCDVPDNWSKWYLNIERKYLRNKKPYKTYKIEHFPYIEWIGRQCNRKYEYPEAKEFYESTWGKQSKRGKSFLNLCKVMLIKMDENLANECYAAEALNRYLSSMFYGILISFIIILFALIKQYSSSANKLSLLLLAIEFIYFISAFLIIRNYHYIRLKEVETVFAATFACRETFQTIFLKENQKTF